MKTIVSIIEVVLFNLLPAPVAAPVVNMIKEFIPLVGIAITRVSLHMALWSQKVNNSMTQKIHQAKLFQMDLSVFDHQKKLRA